MVDTLERRVRRDGVPFLGICVGMQLLATRGTEHGITQGSAGCRAPWIASSRGTALKVPHMGWNTLDWHRPHPLTAGLPLGPKRLHAYFPARLSPDGGQR